MPQCFQLSTRSKIRLINLIILLCECMRIANKNILKREPFKDDHMIQGIIIIWDYIFIYVKQKKKDNT